MKITVALLKRKHACQSQIDKFAKLFPNGVKVTEDLCVEHAADFNFNWAAQHLLKAPAWAEYERVRAAAGAECDPVRAAAWAEYERVRAAVWAEYERVRAAAFGRLAK